MIASERMLMASDHSRTDTYWNGYEAGFEAGFDTCDSASGMWLSWALIASGLSMLSFFFGVILGLML